MLTKIIQLAIICFGGFLILLGSLGIFSGIIGIIDPVGTKMADDSDPFGVPLTVAQSLALTFFYFLISLLGLLLVFSSKYSKGKFSKINLS